jgi:hypothetical protein
MAFFGGNLTLEAFLRIEIDLLSLSNFLENVLHHNTVPIADITDRMSRQWQPNSRGRRMPT